MTDKTNRKSTAIIAIINKGAIAPALYKEKPNKAAGPPIIRNIMNKIIPINIPIPNSIRAIIIVCLKLLKINLNEFLIDMIIPLFFITKNLDE